MPTKAVMASENHYRETRGEHLAWVNGQWYPPDHVAGSETFDDDQNTSDTEGFLG